MIIDNMIYIRSVTYLPINSPYPLTYHKFAALTFACEFVYAFAASTALLMDIRTSSDYHACIMIMKILCSYVCFHLRFSIDAHTNTHTDIHTYAHITTNQ